MLITVAPRLVYGGRLLPDMLNPKAVVTDDLSTYPLESGGHRDACLTFTIIAEKRQTIEKSGAQFSLSVTDVQGHTLKAEHLLP